MSHSCNLFQRYSILKLSILLCIAAFARADVVTDWNLIASNLAVPARAPAPTSILDLATVHIAMHDAIQAYQGRFESYGATVSSPAGSPIAAAAAAAHDVLVAHFPAQKANLDTVLTNYLTSQGLIGDPGVAVGQQIAAAILALRANDGSFPSNPEIFVGDSEPGNWRPTPPANLPMASPWLGAVTRFTLKDDSQFDASPPPPALNTGEYTHDYNEVKSLGRLNSLERTPAQTALGMFYSDNFLALWERTLRGIAGANLNDIGDSARMFALTNIAAADALMTAWHDKRSYHRWRPITAIQNGDNDGNPDTVGDTSWVPLIATPPYPEYTSGANNLTGSMTRTLEHLFGDKTTFSVTSAAVNKTITYNRFSDMADDVENVRVYQGIHFHSGDAVARRQGTHVADWAFAHVLRPIEGK
jgi:hypothetical protein